MAAPAVAALGLVWFVVLTPPLASVTVYVNVASPTKLRVGW